MSEHNQGRQEIGVRRDVDPRALPTFDRARQIFHRSSYLASHPAPNATIARLEEEIIAAAANGVVPYGERDTKLGPVSYGTSPESQVKIPVPGADDVVVKAPSASWWYPQMPTTFEVAQGDPYNSRRYEGYYFMQARMINLSAATAQFYRHYGALVPQYVQEHNVAERLFPQANPQDHVLQFDVRTVLPTGEQGSLRGGFLQELAFRYFDVSKHLQKADYPFSYVMDTLNGDGDMNTLYDRYQQAKHQLRQQNRHVSDDQIASEAAATIRPYKDWGFDTFRVVEFPEEVGKLVLISAQRTES